MVGDGVIDIKNFFKIAIQKKFQGDISLGVYNRDNWHKDPEEIAKYGYVKMRKIVEEASNECLHYGS